MNLKNAKIRIKKDIRNNMGQTIYKGEVVTITGIWSNESNTILSCEIQKDDVVIITRLLNVI